MGSSGDNEWQVIPPKGRKGRHRLAETIKREAAAAVNQQTHADGVSPRTSFLDVEAIAADHEKLCTKWRESTAHVDLRAIISDNAAAHAGIRTAVCLGVGSFDVKDQSSRYCRSSHDAHVQLEAFRTVVKVLEERSGHKIKCYAQEPSFGPSDKAYCRSLGIEAVDNPDAFRYVTAEALVFGVHLPHVAWGQALKDHLPGLYIGTDLKSLEGLNTHFQDDEALVSVIDRVTELDRLADRYVFPGCEHHTSLEVAFYSTEILWVRKDADFEADDEADGCSRG